MTAKNSHRQIIKILKLLRGQKGSSKVIKDVFTKGNCGNIYFILKELYPEATPFMLVDNTHIVTKIGKYYYDINGDVTNKYVGFKYVDENTVADMVNNYCYKINGPLA